MNDPYVLLMLACVYVWTYFDIRRRTRRSR